MSYGQQSPGRGRVALQGTQLDYVFVGYQGTVQVRNARPTRTSTLTFLIT